MTMRDLIEKLKERPTTVEEHREEQREEWKKAVDNLFTEIEGWLALAVNAGVLTSARSEITLVEQELGEYVVPVLRISDGRLVVRLEPVGGRVAGVVAAGGRRHIASTRCIETALHGASAQIARERE